MRIGIDIDGVMTDMDTFMYDYGIKFCQERGITYHPKRGEYYENAALGITDEQVEMFWNEYLEFYATNYGPREFAKEVIHQLKEKHEIYIITARNEEGLPPETYGQMQSMVKNWLKQNEIEYDKLIFTKNGKLPYCIENNIELMIDDSPKNIIEIATKIPVFCYDNSYNREIEGENITRVYSWYDILNRLT